MLFCLIDIFITVRIRKRAVIQPNDNRIANNRANQQKSLQLQMLILLITSTSIFFITTFPITIYRITSPREIDYQKSVFEITVIWTGLGWFQSLNFAVCYSLFLTIYGSFDFVDQFLSSLFNFKIISQRI